MDASGVAGTSDAASFAMLSAGMQQYQMPGYQFLQPGLSSALPLGSAAQVLAGGSSAAATRAPAAGEVDVEAAQRMASEVFAHAQLLPENKMQELNKAKDVVENAQREVAAADAAVAAVTKVRLSCGPAPRPPPLSPPGGGTRALFALPFTFIA